MNALFVHFSIPAEAKQTPKYKFNPTREKARLGEAYKTVVCATDRLSNACHTFTITKGRTYKRREKMG